MPDLLIIVQYLLPIQSWFISFWWVWALFPLFLFGRGLWLTYVQDYYRQYPRILLELKIPREVRKTPRAMEQVFTAIHALRNSAGNFEEKWIQGEVPEIFSCEVASFGGEIHFYMRIPKRHQSMTEAALYGAYPDIEITEAEDYVTRMPHTFAELDKAGYNLFGNELLLSKPNKTDPETGKVLEWGETYPIRTYVDFEAVDEIKELDPIGPLLELLGNLRPEEQVWVQVVLQPLVNLRDVGGPDEISEWRKKGEDTINAIKGAARSTVDPQSGQIVYTFPSPVDTDTMRAIDRNISKPAFWTVVRYLYIAPKGIFTTNFGQRGVYSAMNQYASESYNKFSHNIRVWTRTGMWYKPYFFPGARGRARKSRIWHNYRTRKTHDDTFVARLFEFKFFDLAPITRHPRRNTMSTEVLATIYHMPTYLTVTGPFVRRVEARAGGPPAGLPIYGEGEERLPGQE